MESRKAWVLEDENRGLSSSDISDKRLFVNSGMLRVQPSDHLATLEKETLANMQRDGFRDTQFVESDSADCERAEKLGWKHKLLHFKIPDSPEKSYEAVLDSLAGFLRCSNACDHYREVAVAKGVKFYLGAEDGAVESLVKVASTVEANKEKISGLKTKGGAIHQADVVVVAGRSPRYPSTYYADILQLDHSQRKYFPT